MTGTYGPRKHPICLSTPKAHEPVALGLVAWKGKDSISNLDLISRSAAAPA